MGAKRVLLLLGGLLLCSSGVRAEQPPVHFLVVIPSYNNEKLAEGNLMSVLHQKVGKDPFTYRICYIDDASKDATLSVVRSIICREKKEDMCTIMHNERNRGGLANVYDAVMRADPKDVIVIVDGDDKLAHNKVLQRVALEYARHGAWMTHGSYVKSTGRRGKLSWQPSKSAFKKRTLRTLKWLPTHLKTFYAKLFQSIRKEDLCLNGSFFKAGWDVAVLFPMAEMAAEGHCRYIPQTVYLYNDASPICDFKIHAAEQRATNKIVRSRPPYAPLRSLF